MTAIPEEYADLLQSTALLYVATIRPKGEPQNNPVWFGWDGEHVLFSVTNHSQKYRNIQRDPRVGLSIVDPANPFRFLEIRGVAHIEEDTDRRFIDSLAKKYIHKDAYPWGQPDDEWVRIVVEPQHITTNRRLR